MNVLLIGGGWIAEMVYVPFLSSMPKIETIFILDVDYESTKRRFLENTKVKVVTEAELSTVNYALVCILTPNYMHYENLLRCLDNSSLILVEKPICSNATQLADLKTACANKTNIYVSAPFRYRADLQHLKDIVQTGDLGKIYHTEISWLKRRGTPGSAWFTQHKYSGGGVLMDMGPHLLDLFYWLLGRRTAQNYLGSIASNFLDAGDAYADWHRNNSVNSFSDVEDTAISLLSFKDLSLSLNTSWASNIENDYAQIKIYGDKQYLNILTSVGFSTNTLYKETKLEISSGQHTNTLILEIEDRKEPFRKMLTDLVDNPDNGLPTAADAIHVMSDIFNLYANATKVKEA